MSQTAVDTYVYSIGGASQLAVFQDLTQTIENAMQDARVASRRQTSNQITKRVVTLDTNLFSVKTAPVKVSALDLSAITIGGTSVKPDLISCNLQVTNEFVDTSAPDEEWEEQTWVSQDVTASVQMRVPATSGGVIAGLAGGSLSGTRVALSVTLNSVTTTLDMIIQRVAHSINRGALQEYTVELVNAADDTGNHPDAPTGTTTIYEKAWNDPGTALAIVTHGKNGNSLKSEYNAVISSMSLNMQNGQLIPTELAFRSTGSPTFSQPSAV